MTRALLVAERMNLGHVRWPHADRIIEAGKLERWLSFSKDVGAFGTGMTRQTYAVRKRLPGRRKLEEVGVRYDEALNLLPPGPCGAWDAGVAGLVADELRRLIVTAHDEAEHLDLEPRFAEWRFDRLVLVGRRVAAAMGMGDLELWERRMGCIVVPHPSGRNRWWNELTDETRRECRATMDSFYTS